MTDPRLVEHALLVLGFGWVWHPFPNEPSPWKWIPPTPPDANPHGAIIVGL